MFNCKEAMRRKRWAGHVERMGEGRGLHRVLVGRFEGKRQLGRTRHRWEGVVGTGWSWLRIGRGDEHF